MKHTFTIILIVWVAICFVSCTKKNNPVPKTSGKDEIVLSINNGASIHYDKSTYNPATERNYRTLVDFSRTYYTTPTRLPQDFNIIDITLNDQNIFDQPMPYQVKNSFVYISIETPDNLGTFSFSTAPGSGRGHVGITINSASGQRLKGSFNGVIYSSYNQSPQPDSLTINGSFDVMLPAFVNQ